MLPAVGQRVGVLGEIGLHRGPVKLPEDGIEIFLRLLFELLLRQLLSVRLVGLMRDVGVEGDDVVIGRRRRLVRGRRIGPAPGRFLADGPGLDQAVFVPDLVDHVLGDEICRQPLVPHGIHGGIDVDRAPFLDERIVGIDTEEVQPFQTEDDEQPDGQRLQRLFDLLLFLPAGALGDPRAAGRAE